ncbi:hypothetical protein [Symbiobacterium thermophilum]|uniref:Uncharacterized protein n=1 Tax=Symbiobacterium thermophilum TaxID=2734 RepID=A0A953IEX1_SYMTR|nr:hypothetical protein [Symbiobacterium thermophilum]MBY6277195.1 hypothetical protein [Symbiobacterium thermophilum]
MMRGDVDRFYRAIRREHPEPPPGPIRHLDHVRTIADYYARLSQQERLLMLAWARKEESGIGIIPLALSAIPFFGLIVSARLQEVLNRLPIWQVFVTWLLFGSLVLLGFYVHQSQKAWTALHITLLEQAIAAAEAAQSEPAQAGAPDGDQPQPSPEDARRLTFPPETGVH